MFAPTLILCALALAADGVSAQAQQNSTAPPGCLIRAANELPGGLANYKGFCGNSSAVDGKLTDYCQTQYYDPAVSAYSAVCKDHGFTVAPISHSPSGLSSHGEATATSLITTAVFDSSCSCTKTTVMTSVAYAAASATGADSAGATGASSAATTPSGTSGSGGKSGGAAAVGISVGAVTFALAALAFGL